MHFCAFRPECRNGKWAIGLDFSFYSSGESSYARGIWQPFTASLHLLLNSKFKIKRIRRNRGKFVFKGRFLWAEGCNSLVWWILPDVQNVWVRWGRKACQWYVFWCRSLILQMQFAVTHWVGMVEPSDVSGTGSLESWRQALLNQEKAIFLKGLFPSAVNCQRKGP